MKKKEYVPVCFIILHYNDDSLTKLCIEALLSLNGFGRSKIVVVDNASPNGSGERLKMHYRQNDSVHVIINRENCGFSAGNNVGYEYVRSNYMPDFVIALNNDAIIQQKDFLKKLFDLYVEFPFWVAGPDIIMTDRFIHQNPIANVNSYYDKKQTIEIYRKARKQIRSFQKMDLYAIKEYIKEKYRHSIALRLYSYAKSIIYRNKTADKQMNGSVCLFGACLIFDKRYIQEKKQLFKEITFMYFEEHILMLDSRVEKKNVIYFPQLKVQHMNCGSLSAVKLSLKEYCIKRIRQLTTCCTAAKEYAKYLKEFGHGYES